MHVGELFRASWLSSARCCDVECSTSDEVSCVLNMTRVRQLISNVCQAQFHDNIVRDIQWIINNYSPKAK